MASVHLAFTPPYEPDIASLHIEESASSSGPFVEIESVTDIGDFPDYITEYTTSLATVATDWFRIRWLDSKGAYTNYSQPFPGGGTTLVGQVVQRVRERMPSLSIQIVTQEAEAAIQRYFGDIVNPYDVTLTANYRVLNGLVYLVLAHALMVEGMTASTAESTTIGLVSVRRNTALQNTKDLDGLIALANAELGINSTVVLELEEVCGRWDQRSTWQQQYDSIPWVIVA